MQSGDTAIVVVSFDGYSDVWPVFAQGLNRFWSDRPFETYLVTNEAEPSFDSIRIVKTGEEISWSRRLRTALSQIDSEYIILLLEDYLLCKDVNNADVLRLIDFMKANSADYMRIAPIPKIKSDAPDNQPVPLPQDTLYGVNLQAGIWKKDYLLSLADGDISAWEFEARQKNGAPTQIKGNCYAVNYFPVKYLNGIIQGKWYPETVKAYKRLGVGIDTRSRGVMATKAVIKSKFKRWLVSVVPAKTVRNLKPLAKKLGFHFVTD